MVKKDDFKMKFIQKLLVILFTIIMMLITNSSIVSAMDTIEDFEGWGFVDDTPALSGGVCIYGNWIYVAKLDGVAANDGAVELWASPTAAFSISTEGGNVDEFYILNINGDEFNFGGFNFTGYTERSMFVTGWRDGIQVTQRVNISYTASTSNEYFDMRSRDSEFKNVDEIRICGVDLGGGDFDVISGDLESFTYDTDPVDEVPPLISVLTMTSDNANVSTVAKVGDKVTLNITANENIQSPTVTIAGHMATVDDAGDSDAKTWKATYTMQELDTAGTIPFTIDFKDIANNEAMQVTSITVGSAVIFDKTPPAAPTAVTVTPVGGTVITNCLNKSNTNLIATAAITMGDATGGKAELYIKDKLIAVDNSIVSEDTQVTFDLGKSTNPELQAVVSSGGTVSVKLYDMAGNSSTSSIGNPTLTVDYISELPAPPTAIVQAITGTLQVGAKLTGNYTYSDVNGDLEGISIYEWYRSDNIAGLNKTEISGATEMIYELTSADEGKYISFVVIPVAFTGTAQGIPVESALVGAIVPAEAPPTATVQPITGTLQVGAELTGHYTYSDVNGDLEGASIYEWLRSDNSAGVNKTYIAGANEKTYVLTSADEGKYISFLVRPVALTGIDQGNSFQSTLVGAIVPAEVPPTATVQAIIGTLQVGAKLTGNYTYSDVNGDLEGISIFQWYRSDNSAGLNKTEILGATEKTYVLTSADEGKYISFVVRPVASTGAAQGIPVESTLVGVIVAAEAPPTEYTLTYTAGANGTITGTATQKVNSGANGSAVTATPNSGYHFVGWSDGVITATRTDSSVTGNITVTANFAITSSPSPTPPTTPSTPTTSTPSPAQEIRQASVNGVREESAYAVATVDVVRKISDDKKVDTVALGRAKTEEVIKKVLEQNQDKIQIAVDEPEDDKADEIKFTIDKDAVKKLADSEVALDVKTEAVSIEIPKESVLGISEKEMDVYFRVVPIRNEEEKTATIQNAMTAGVVQEAAGSSEVIALGTPMMIETNYQGLKTTLVFSLKDVAIPEDKTQRALFLRGLGVYIKHSDGEQEFIRGTILYDSNGYPIGIEIEISKFSTFTMISIINEAPIASDVAISGKAEYGKKLTASYTYYDKELDKEGKSLITWYRADNKKGKNKKPVAKGTLSYKIVKADQGKYLILEITPVATGGEPTGSTVSAYVKVAANKAPKAVSNKISGKTIVGSKLTLKYTYQDTESDKEGKTTIQWYRADSSNGANKKKIKNANKSTYTLTKADQGKYIIAEITPVAKTGNKVGKKATVATKTVIAKAKVSK